TTDGYNWRTTFQGMRYHFATGMLHADARDYSPTLERWVQQDPAGYINGLEVYAFAKENPVIRLDPSGFVSLPPPEVAQEVARLVSKINEVGMNTPDGQALLNKLNQFMVEQGIDQGGEIPLPTQSQIIQQEMELDEGAAGLEGEGGFIAPEMLGVLQAGAGAGIITYLAFQNGIQYYQNQAAEGDFLNQSGNMNSMSNYWHRQFNNWGNSFLKHFTHSPGKCCDPNKMKEAQ